MSDYREINDQLSEDHMSSINQKPVGVIKRLYRGDVDYDFMRHRKLWYGVSIAMLVISAIALGVNKLNFSTDFTGGTMLYVSDAQCDVTQARESVVASGATGEPKVQQLGGKDIRIQADLALEKSEPARIKLAQDCKVVEDKVTSRAAGKSWSTNLAKNALKGLIVFLILVTIFLSIYFEWKMALAALIALLHDLAITIGLYALVGFEVSPATVIGLLTILGYSLYDTVVVFDKVKENTAGLLSGSRATYEEATNAAVNQSLVRSINTSIIAVLPVASIFFVGAFLLGAGTLKDISLVQLVGTLAGAYSSIFIAAPLLAQLKSREPAVQALAKRVAQRRSSPKPQVKQQSSRSTHAETPLAVKETVVSSAGSGQRQQPARKKPGSGKKSSRGKGKRR